MTAPIVGIEDVVKNLTKEIKKIRGRTVGGVLEAAQYVKGESQAECPVVTGALKNSAYVKPFGTQKKPGALVGYSSVYALSVHENPRAGATEGFSPSGKPYRAPLLPSGRRSTQKVYSTVGKWKFLEDPLRQSADKILDIIRRKAKIR